MPSDRLSQCLLKMKVLSVNTQLTSGCHARLKSRAATPICSGGVNLEARSPQVSTERSPAIRTSSWEEALAPRLVLSRSDAPSRGVRAAEMHLDPRTKGLPSENSPPRAERRRRRSAPGREGAPPGEPTGACPRGAKPTGTARQSAVRASAIRVPPAAAASHQGGPRGRRAPPRAGGGRRRVRLRRRNTGRKARAGGRGGGSGQLPAIGPAPPGPPRRAPPSPRPPAPGGQSQGRARDERCLR